MEQADHTAPIASPRRLLRRCYLGPRLRSATVWIHRLRKMELYCCQQRRGWWDCVSAVSCHSWLLMQMVLDNLCLRHSHCQCGWRLCSCLRWWRRVTSWSLGTSPRWGRAMGLVYVCLSVSLDDKFRSKWPFIWLDGLSWHYLRQN